MCSLRLPVTTIRARCAATARAGPEPPNCSEQPVKQLTSNRMTALNAIGRIGATSLAALTISGALMSGTASAAPSTIPFQVDPFIPFVELPTPRLAATVGEEPGVAVLHVRRTPDDGNPHAAVVHWLSPGTGTYGSASFPTLDAQPVTIRPGSGQVIAYVAPQAIGTPGFGTFFVP